VTDLLPQTPAVACFDTAFHATLPAEAHTYALCRAPARTHTASAGDGPSGPDARDCSDPHRRVVIATISVFFGVGSSNDVVTALLLGVLLAVPSCWRDCPLVRRVQDGRPCGGHLGAVVVPVPGRWLEANDHVAGDLSEGQERKPVHVRHHVGPARLVQPVGLVPEKLW
jgi:Acetokinase family